MLIGDAAHATTPHMGQGSAQAVEDAVVLGELLARNAPVEHCSRSSCSAAMSAAAFIVESSLQLGEWEQSPVPTADPVGLTAKMLATVAAPI
jgi:flavin-dependent dehydrogenase